MLLSSAGLSSSSEADEPLFTRSAQQLERLWSGVLGCAERSETFPIRNRFKDYGNANRGVVPVGTSRDYSQCGKRALRNTSSRMLVNTIEGAVRSGGVALISDRFRLDSSIGWIWREGATGAVDAIVPLLDGKNSDGTGHALFLQPGAVFWQGIESEDRIDTNLGIAFRRHFTPDVIGGWSGFYDYDFKRKHRRLGIGMDIQSGVFHTAVNYYYPLNEWQEGRTGYEEQPLEGVDLRLGLEWPRIRLDASVASWRFEGEIDEETKWRPSFSAEAGFHILPGIFLEAGYERQDEDSSIGSQWSTGLAFRFTLPGLDGLNAFEDSTAAPNLFEPVKREKRILYEERQELPRATLAAMPARVEEGNDVTVRVVLGKAIEQNVFFSVAALSSSTANTDDYDPLPSRITIPAGSTSAEATFGILDDPDSEPDEILDLELRVLPESFFFVARGDTHRARVVIEASDNSVVGFATESTYVAEGIEVHVPLVLGEPAPSDGLILVALSDKDDVVVDGEMRISPGAREGQYIRVTVNADDIPEDAEMARIVLSESSSRLPEGWRFSRSEHMLTILPNDQTAMFAKASESFDEDAGSVSFEVTLSADAPEGGVPLEVDITSGNDDGDVAFTTQSFTIAEGENEHTLTVDINDDDLVETNEVVTFTLSKDASAVFPDEWGDLGAQMTYRLTITDDDSTSVGFASSSSTLTEGGTAAPLTVRLNGSVSQPVEVTISESGDTNNDLAFSPSSLTFAPGETEKEVTLTVNTANNDALPEGDVEITYTLTGSLPGGVSFATESHVVTFVDDDKTIRFRDASSSASEGTSGHLVAVVLNFDPPAEGLEVEAVSTGEHKDEVSIPSTPLNFTGNTRELSVSVDVLEDSIREDAEVVRLELQDSGGSLPEGWTLLASGNNDHDLSILPSDQTAMFAEAGKTADEGDGTITFKVTLSADAPAGGVPLEVAITSGNDNNDVTFATQRFTIIAGSREHTISVDINDDNQVEPEEVVRFTLSKGASAAFPDAWGDLGTQTTFNIAITDNDSTTVGFTTASSTLLESNASAVLTVSLVGSVSQDVVVTLNESGDVNNDLTFSTAALTFAPGERNKHVTLTVNAANNDTTPEGDAEITYTLAGTLPNGVTFGAKEHVVTLVDDDKTVGFRESSSSATEGTVGHLIAVVLNFDPPAGGLEVSATVDSAHTLDVSISSPVLNFTGNTRELFLLVNVLGDNLPEGAESIELTLSGQLPETWNYAQRTHDLMVPPNENEIAFERAFTSVNEDGGTVNVVLKLNRPAPEGMVLAFRSSSPSDAVPASSTLQVPAGARDAMLAVNIVNDGIGELEDTVTISILGSSPTTLPEGWSIGSQDTHDLIVTDDDLVVGFERASSQVRESDLTTGLPIVLSEIGAPTGGINLSVSATGNEGNDVSFPSILPISTGEDRKELMVALTQDGFAEENEVIVLALSGSLPPPWRFSQETHQLTILLNEQTAMFAEDGKTADEGDGMITFKVTLAADAPVGGVPLEVAITSGNEDNDVTFATQSFRIAEGNREHTISVDINDDTLVEPSEMVTFTLSKDASAVFPEEWGGLGTQTTFELIITDNDSTSIGFTTPSTTLLEGDASAILAVKLNGSVSQNVVVTLTESGDVNNDIAFSPSSLTFAPGETDKQVALTVNNANNDALAEGDVEITYTLTGTLPGGVNFATSEHVVTFVDDDKTISFKGSSSSASEGTVGHPVAVELNFDPPAEGLHVAATATGDHAADVSISSPTLNFTGNTRELSVLVNVLEDVAQEGVEIVLLELGEATTPLPEGWTLIASGDNDHDLTILPSDQTAMFAEAGKTADEGDGTISFQVELSADAPVGGVPLEVSIASGNEDGDVTFTTQSFTITQGTRAHTLTVGINEDALVEPDETITFTLSKDASAVFPDAWGDLGTQTTFDLTITDNDNSTVGFASGSSTLREGDGTATLRVVLSNPVSEDVVLALSESGDTNNEVAFSPRSVTFASRQTSKEITLTVVDDNTVEPGATITYTLTGTLPDDVSLGTDNHVVTFIDDDSSTIGFTMPSSTLSEGDSTDTLTVSLSAEVSQDVVVTLTESGDGNNDLEFTPTSLTFAPGDTSHDVTLTVSSVNDNRVEEDVEITYTLTGTLPDDVGFGTNSHVVTFTDDDSATVGFASGSSTLREGDGTETLRVVLSNPVSEDVVLALSESGDTNNQVAFSLGSLTFASGETSKEITLTVVDDNTVEPGATITYTLAGTLPGNLDVSFGTQEHVVTFTDDDTSTIRFASGSSTLREDDSRGTLSVVLTNPVSEDVMVTLTESGDTNNEVAFSPSSLTFAPGDTSKDVTLTVVDDSTVEPGATITYTLTGTFPDDVTLGTREHVVTLTDDDSSTIGFTMTSSTLSEGDSTANLTVELSAPVSQSVEVVLTESGDGKDDLDFSPNSLTFAPGERNKQVTLTVNASNNDNKVEGDVQITYTLTGSFPDDVTLDTDKHVVTFMDDDISIVGFASGSSTLREGDGTETLRVVLSNPVSEDVVLALSESGDTNNQVAFSPGSLTFASGQTSKEITLTVVDDNTVEPGATITYTLAGTLPGNLDVSFGTRDHVVTFIDDDSATVGFATASSTLSEGDSTDTLTVSLSAEVSQDVVVTLTESGDGNNDLTFSPSSMTFASGETDKQVTLTVNAANNDNKVEEDVEITYTLTGAFSGNVRLDASRNTHVVTFMDDDSAMVGFTAPSSTLNEGDSTDTLTVSLSAEVSREVVVDLTESGDVNNDLTFSPAALTFAPGETSKQVTLTVNASNSDNKVEEDVEITYTLTGTLPDDLTISTASHVVTFTDDDSATVGFASGSSTLREGDGTATLRVVLTNPVSQDVIVTLSESGDTNNEVSFAQGSLTFAPGDTSKDVTLTVVDDNRVEPGATITYTLALAGTPPDDVSLGTRDHVVTFIDDDSSTIGFTAASSTLSEGDSTTNLTVELSAPVSQDVMVVLTESGDDNNDLIISPETLTFAPGETDKQVTLTVNASNNDNKVEGDVQITYTLTGSFPDDVTLGTREHVVTFTDDDTSIVGFASGSLTLREGDGTATLRVELTNPVSEDVIVTLSESGDTNNEVSFAPGSLTFTSGQTSKEITLTVVDDNTVEPGATITYTLTGSFPDDVSLGTRDHVVTFIDDDSATIGFATASSTLSEGDSTDTLTISLSAPSAQTVTVTLTESGDDNNDLIISPETLTFAPGVMDKQVTLTVNAANNDNKVEEDVEITYTLTGAFSGNVRLDASRNTHVVTFMDDDSAMVGFTAPSSTLNEGDSTDTLTVSLSAEVSREVVVDLKESGDVNNDLTFSPAALTFAPGETSKQVTLTVNASNSDNKVEEDVEITYTLTGTLPDDVTISTASHVVTFTDDDSAMVGFTAPSSTLRENEGTATLRVTLTNPVSQDVIVTLSESGDANNEVAFTPRSLTFASGQTSKEITLTVVDDNTVEPGATITYTLTGTPPDDVTLATSSHVVTFTDDDTSIVGFASGSSILREGDGTATLSVVLTNPVSEDVVVTLNESGDGNDDLTFSPSSLLFTPGETSHNVTLTVNSVNDNQVEEDVEITYTLTGTPPDDVRFGTSSHVVTFADDDSSEVGFASRSSSLREADGTATLRVVLTNPVSQPVEITISESGDTNNEVAFSPSSLTFAPGDTSKNVTLTVQNDSKVEPSAIITYTLTGSLPDDVSFDTANHVVTFIDDDSATVGFVRTSSTLSEGDNTDTLMVSLSAPSAQLVTVTLTESGDGNDDLTFSPDSLTFTPGERSKQVILTVNAFNNDNKVEEDVEITYTLTGTFSGNVRLDASRNTHVVTFTDDDSATVGFTSSSSTLSEDETSTASLTVSLSAEVSQGVVVDMTESGDGNSDLEFAPTSLTFAPGETSKQVTLTVNAANNDNKVEGDVHITYTLTGSFPDDVTLGTREHVVTFTDDDTSIVGFASGSSTLREGDGTATLRVELTNPVSENVVVALNESGDTNDQVAFTPSSLTFSSGETSKEITLTVVDDNTVEPGAIITYTLTGSLPDDVSLGTASHEVTFIDDDSATGGFASPSSTLSEGDSTANLTVELSAPVSEDVVVTLNESGDGNEDITFSPSSLTFSPGDTSKQVTLTVNTANNDNKVEEDVEITYTLTTGVFSGNVGLDTSRTTHVVTFTDDDASIVGFASSSSALSENDGTEILSVVLTNPVSQDVIVTLTESGDINNQVAFTPNSLTFTGGETSHNVTLTVVDDNTVEPGATITYTLTGSFPDDVSLGAREHVVTLTDDDTSIVGFASRSSTLREGDGTATLSVVLTNPVSEDVVVTLNESGDGNDDLTLSPSSLLFTPGETSHNVTLTVNAANNDTAPEGDVEITYTLTGTLPDDVSFATREHVVTFTDDDKIIRFRDASSSASEGTVGHPVAVELNFDPPAEGLEVSAVAKGDHKDDVSIPLPLLSFTGSIRELPVMVDVLDDIEQEDAEVVQLELEETSTPLPLGWTLIASGEDDHDLTIELNDRTAEFAEAGDAVNEDVGTVSFRVTLSGDAPVGGVPLEVAITSGNDDGDVTFTAQSFTIAEDNREHTLTVDINDDIQVEPDEVVRFTLSKGGSFPQTWGDLGSQTTFDLTILANDGSVQFANPTEQMVEENAGQVMIPLDVTVAPPTDGLPLRVEIAGHGNNHYTATTDDYSFDPLAFTLMPAEAGEGYNLVFSVIDDDLPEKEETFVFTLHAGEGFPTGWGGLGDQKTRYLTIQPNDRTIGFADTLPAELREGTLNFPLEVVWNAYIEDIKDRPTSIRLGVEIEKADGGGTDPEEFDVLLEFPPDTFNEFQDTSHESDYLNYTGYAGSDTRIEINVQDDKIDEEDEDIVVRLVSKQGYPLTEGWSIDPAEYRFTIPANDKFIGFATADSSLVEPNGDPGAQVSGNVVVKLNGPAPVGGLNLVVSVDEETNDDGENIDANVEIGEGGVLFIPAGTEEVLVPVTVLSDDIPESDEPVVLTLSKGANWLERWEIGGLTDTGNLSATHTVTILGNDKKVGWRDAIRKLVSEANYASVSPVVTNYPAPDEGLDLTVNVEPGLFTLLSTGSHYEMADVRTDGSGDLFYRENVRIRPKSRFAGVNTVAPVDDGIAERDEVAVFRLSGNNNGQLPPGWEWSNRDLRVIILANDNDFTFTDQNDATGGSHSEGTTVRLTAVGTSPLPSPVSDDDHETFSRRVGYFGIEVTENSEDISITPVAPVIYHPDYHHPDGSRKTGISQPIKGGQDFFADYAFTVTEGGQLESVSFDVAIHEDSKTEPPETVVITLSISGSWGLRPTTRQYTLTINDEGGTGMIGFSQAEIDRGPYGLYEKASLSTQRPGVLVELSSPSPPGGIDLMMLSSDPGQLLVGGNIRVPENRRGCYVTQLPVSTGSNYHFPEHRERCYFTDFNTVSDGIPEGDETYDIIISEDPARPLPPKWSIDSERSRREVTIYSSDNKVGIAGFVDPDSGSIPENDPIPIEMIEKSVSLDEDEGLARLVLNVPNDPVPGGLRLRLKVTPDATTPGASVADFDNIYRDNDFIIPRRNQAGPFQHVIEIPITDDTDAEQLESFSFALQFQHSSGNHNTWGNIDWGNNSATLTINQNDQTFGWEEESVEITENSNGGVGFANLVFSSPVDGPVSFITFSVDSPTGENQNDLIVSESPVRTGDNKYSLALTVRDDNHAEADETFIVTASPGSNFPSNYTPTPSIIRVTIPANDNLVGFTNATTEVNEDIGTVDVTLTLTNPAPVGGLPLRIPTLTTATSGSDFTFTEYGEDFTIMPEDGLEYTFTVNIDDDNLAENTEIYDLVLEKGDGFPDEDGGWGTLSEQATHRLTILENDQTISVEFENIETIADEGDGTVPVKLMLSNPAPASGMDLVLERENTQAPFDYTLVGLDSGTGTRINPNIHIEAGAKEYVLFVAVTDDDEIEIKESFNFTIRFAAGYNQPRVEIGEKSTHKFTIRDSDFGTIGFAQSSATLVEVKPSGSSASREINLNVQLSHALPVDVEFKISGRGSDTDGSPDVSVDGFKRMIPAGQTTASFRIRPILDGIAEPDELITYTIVMLEDAVAGISIPNSLEVSSTPFELTIPANENTVRYTTLTSTAEEGESIEVGFTLTNPAPDADLAFTFRHFDLGSSIAVAGIDYTGDIRTEQNSSGENLHFTDVTIPAGETSHKVVFDIVDDDMKEEVEKVRFTITGTSGIPMIWGMFGEQIGHDVTIVRNDQGIVGFDMESKQTTLVEGEVADLKISLMDEEGDPVSALPGSVDLQYAVFEKNNGTASNDLKMVDGTPGTGQFTIPANHDTSQPFILRMQAINDGYSEMDEILEIRLSFGSNYPADWGLSSTKSTHDILIPANENIVRFANTNLTLEEEEEDRTYMIEVTSSTEAPVGGLPLKVGEFSSSQELQDSDYSFTMQSFTILEGESSYRFPFTVHADTVGENDEEIRLELSKRAGFPDGVLGTANWGNLNLANSTMTITIPANDNTISFASAGPTMLQEGSDGVNLEILINRPVPQAFQLDIEVTGEDGMALQELTFDLGGAKSHTTLNVPANASSIMLPVWAYNDTTPDAEKRATITISTSGTNADRTRSWKFVDNTHEVILLANENTVRYTTLTSSTKEGESIEVGFTLTNPAPEGDLTFTFQHLDTNNSSSSVERAIAGIDYTGDIRTERWSGVDLHYTDVRIPAGETSHKVVFDIVDDDVTEKIEETRFTVIQTFGIPRGWGVFGEVIPDGQAGTPEARVFHDVTIARSDPVVVRFDMEGEQTTLVEGEVADLKIRPTNEENEEGNSVSALPGPVNLQYAVFEKNGTASNDLKMVDGTPGTGQFTIPANHDPSQPFILRMQAIDDGYSEMDEILEIRLSFVGTPPEDWSLLSTKSTHDILIPANENIVRFANTNLTLEEEEEDRTYMIEVTSSTEAPVGGLPLKVGEFSSSQELQDSDYSFTMQSFTILEGESSYRFPFTVHADTVGENDEEIRLELSKRAGFPDGVLGTANWGDLRQAAATMEIIIPANDNTISFASAGPTTLYEQEGERGGKVDLEILINRPVPQAFQLDIEVTGEDGMALQELAFDLGGANSSTTLDVPANASSIMLPVWAYNDTTPDAEKRATITISTSGTNADRTRGWTFVNNTHEVILPANDHHNNAPTGPSPPRLPNPIRPPTQETSPKPDEFQKKVEVTP